MSKLNGWQRIGVILSVLWIVVVPILERNTQIEAAHRVSDYQYRTCNEGGWADLSRYGAKGDKNSCLKAAGAARIDLLKVDAEKGMNLALLAIAPVLLGWLAAWMAIRLYGWVAAGFKKA